LCACLATASWALLLLLLLLLVLLLLPLRLQRQQQQHNPCFGLRRYGRYSNCNQLRPGNHVLARIGTTDMHVLVSCGSPCNHFCRNIRGSMVAPSLAQVQHPAPMQPTGHPRWLQNRRPCVDLAAPTTSAAQHPQWPILSSSDPPASTLLVTSALATQAPPEPGTWHYPPLFSDLFSPGQAAPTLVAFAAHVRLICRQARCTSRCQ
jgi:hypothetical protein